MLQYYPEWKSQRLHTSPQQRNQCNQKNVIDKTATVKVLHYK